MSDRFIRVDREAHLTIITLDRPQSMNALTPMGRAELMVAIEAFDADPDQWVAIVTGAGDRAFCAGNDLKYLADKGVEAVNFRPSEGTSFHNRFGLRKPVIAAVNGVAMGGGFEIALACDLIIAAETARFALPEPRVGVAALGGGLHRLPRAIGLTRALGLILTGREVLAAEGERLGFVNAVVPPADLMAEARRWAGMIIEAAPLAVRASKEAVYRGLDEPTLAAAINATYPATLEMLASEDVMEGARAFAEKRKPLWKGR